MGRGYGFCRKDGRPGLGGVRGRPNQFSYTYVVLQVSDVFEGPKHSPKRVRPES